VTLQKTKTKTKMQTHQNHNIHDPVLLARVLEYLDPVEGESYLDVTAGYGGHAAAVLERTLAPDNAVLVDRDQNAIAELQAKFSGQAVQVFHSDFLSAARELAAQGRHFDCILADLGVSSPHLNNADRGFSITQDGPLDMRMDQRQPLTAANLVNEADEADLADILARYGEEPKAKRIAHEIVAARPINSTAQLAAIAAKAWPPHSSRIHPATRTFQALRIAVNDELSMVQQAIPLWINLLKPGGRLAIISFHSLEDRIVKRVFAEHGGDRYDATLRLLTKTPVTASAAEIALNPRSRSAKLRAAAKINNKK
jgi:16S rRNA (cytosine1402-N4)-methyltransferase